MLADTELSSICAHLAQQPSLYLPSSLPEDAGQDRKEAYLKELLARDAGVFLERYGRQLSPREVGAFGGLAEGNAEVAHYLGELGRGPEASTPSQRKNRRRAFLERLLAKDDYFSEESMRGRAPLLYHEMVGQFEPAPVAEPAPKLSETLLRHYDVNQQRDALRAEQVKAGQGVAEPARESPARPDAGQRAHRPLNGRQEEEAGEEEEEEEDSSEEEEEYSALDGRLLSQAEREERAERRAAEQRRGPPLGDGGHAQQQPPPSLSPEELAENREDFLQAMQARFLAGEEGADFDYARIDGDRGLGLDDANDRIARQDAEDKYFEAE